MSLDLLVGPLVTITTLPAFAWRLLSAIARSHHRPLWYAAAAIGFIVLGIVVVGLLLELAREVQKRRECRDQIMMQHRYPFCHVTRLSTGRWFLTDKSTGREFLPEGEIGHAVKIGKTRDANVVQQSFGTKPQPASDAFFTSRD
jgi:hypothetical protein